MKSIHRRICRLERSSEGDCPTKVRALAERLGAPADRVSAIAKGHEVQLCRQIGMDGAITWEVFCYLRKLGLWA